MRILRFAAVLLLTILPAGLGSAPNHPQHAKLPPLLVCKAIPVSSGNRLGDIIVPAAGSANNRTTSVPFVISQSIPYLAAVIDNESSGYNFRTGTSAAMTATASDINQLGPATLQIPLNRSGGDNPVIAFYNAGAGGTVKIYQSDGPMTSCVPAELP